MGKVHEEAAPRKRKAGIHAVMASVARASRELARCVEELEAIGHRPDGDPLVRGDYLGLSDREFNERCRTGEIPNAVKLGSRAGWRVRRSDADAYIESLRTASTSPANDVKGQADAEVNAVLAGVGFELRGRR